MKKFKKFLSVLCAACMILAVSAPAFADYQQDDIARGIAYMDLESAPVEMRDDILEARAQIIFGDQAWTVDGVVSIINGDGSIQELPEFSELFPGWEIPDANVTDINMLPVTYSDTIDFEEQVHFTLATEWVFSPDFTQFTGTGGYVYVFAISSPRDAYYNIGFSNSVGNNVGWCPNLNETRGARLDSDAGRTYHVRGSAATEDSEGNYRIKITTDEDETMTWIDPMLP